MTGKSTAVSFVLAIILWTLGVLTFLFNYLGLWAAWHLAGFAFVFYMIIPAIAHLCALGKSLFNGNFDLAITHIIPVVVYSIITAMVAIFCFLRQMKKQ